MKIKIEKGIPLPSKRGVEFNNASNILQSMEVGDSFLCSVQEANTFRAMAPRYGMKVTGRTQEDGSVRVWRVV